MKDIRIFVASSKELLPERNALAYFVLVHEDEFAKRGLRVRLSKWEYVDPTMTEERTEDRYLDEMLNCDAVLMLFRNVLGKYTKEEVDKAIAAETAGSSRIKKHLILFKEGDADGSPELAAWRASLDSGSYGTFTDAGELGAHFLWLVEQVAGLPLQDVADAESEKTISAFLAVDDELAADRDAFADAVLNLNDVLSHRGVRVRLRFYDPEQHREMLDNSEMALVLYQTKCGAFSSTALKESYDRAREEKNPKRLYVFFRDAAGKPLDADFQAFRNGFAESFGSAPCRFENVDTLSLNFLFALESVLGDGAGTFVKLDGRTVVADGLEVGDITKLPMLEKNAGIADLFSRMEEVSRRFVAQREKCDKNPQDDGLYVELLDLSAEKNRLQDQIDRELKMSFNLAKRLAAISIAQVNETIARARAKVEEGDIKGALEILDGASSALKRRRLLHKAAERAEAEALQIKELQSGLQLDLFRIDAVMAYTAISRDERFGKGRAIYQSTIRDLDRFAELVTEKNGCRISALIAEQLLSFAEFYAEEGDSRSPVTLLKRSLCLYDELAANSDAYFCNRAKVRMVLAGNELDNNLFESARANYLLAGEFYRMQGEECLPELAKCLSGLAHLNRDLSHCDDSEVAYCEVLEICRRLARKNPDKYEVNVASTLNNLAILHWDQNRLLAAESEYSESLGILHRLVQKAPGKYDSVLAATLGNFASLHRDQNRPREAEIAYAKALEISRHLAQENPAKFDQDVGMSLHNLAVIHHEQRRLREAESEYVEALAVRRRLAHANPERHGFDVAATLNNLANLHSDQMRLEKAEVEYLESLEIRRRLALANPEKFDSAVAVALNSLAGLHRVQKRLVEAEREYREALEIRRRLAKINAGKFEADVAATLNNLAYLHCSQGRNGEASNEYEESLAIHRRIVSENPGKFEMYLAVTLDNLAYLRYDQSRRPESMAAFAEALAIRRRLVQVSPERFEPDMAVTLSNLASLHRETQQLKKALDEYNEVREIRERLAVADPHRFNSRLAKTLQDLGEVYRDLGDVEHAYESFARALELWKMLAVGAPEQFAKDIENVENALAEVGATVDILGVEHENY